jgi:hypothetical protein
MPMAPDGRKRQPSAVKGDGFKPPEPDTEDNWACPLCQTCNRFSTWTCRKSHCVVKQPAARLIQLIKAGEQPPRLVQGAWQGQPNVGEDRRARTQAREARDAGQARGSNWDPRADGSGRHDLRSTDVDDADDDKTPAEKRRDAEFLKMVANLTNRYVHGTGTSVASAAASRKSSRASTPVRFAPTGETRG